MGHFPTCHRRLQGPFEDRIDPYLRPVVGGNFIGVDGRPVGTRVEGKKTPHCIGAFKPIAVPIEDGTS